MKMIEDVAAMQAISRQWRGAGLRIGLVPTMGFLHAGHLSLVRQAAALADKIVVSIFVNPTQFAPGEDFTIYPRDLAADLDLCREHGVDVVFAPSAADFYRQDHSTWVVEEVLSRGLCGRARPGHFRGVATVVAKLFNAVLPDSAVFGRKDAQQALVIRRMVRDLNFPVDIQLGDIVREPDGLAMSSRNANLKPDDRQRAVCLYQGLQAAANLHREGEIRGQILIAAVREKLLAAKADVDYVEMVDSQTLEPLENLVGEALLLVAVRIGGVRLIDNFIFAAAQK